MKAREFLYKKFKEESEHYFDVCDDKFLIGVCDAWMNDEYNSAHRYREMLGFIEEGALKTCKILDMASGCGTFVFYGLINGYDVYGIDPEEWKHQFIALKVKEKGHPDSWINSFYSGVGESLPFDDNSFDVVST